MNPLLTRLWQLLDLAEKEDRHLLGVRARLFPQDGEADFMPVDLAEALRSPDTIDRLESFVGKFSRMQDTLMDKLLPALLRAVGEPVGSVLDNLNRAERLGLVCEPKDWIAMRLLRNRLVHEYVDDEAQLAAALERARAMVDTLHAAYLAIRNYVAVRSELSRPDSPPLNGPPGERGRPVD